MKTRCAALLFLIVVCLPADGSTAEPRRFEIEVNGILADGWVAYPPGKSPHEYDTLVVFAHGINHQISEPGWQRHLEEAATHGAVAMAMDFSDCFDLDVSSDETIAGTRHFLQKHKTFKRRFLVSVSMGGAVAGMVLADPAGRGLFDHWVSIEGLFNLIETWTEATAVLQTGVGRDFIAPALACIEEDAGGTPFTPGNGYQERTAVFLAPSIASSGIKTVVIVHSLVDGIVPYNQAREMAAALIGAGVENIDFYTVIRGTCHDDTRLYSYIRQDGDNDPRNDFDPVCAAGHATETTNSFVMRTGFDALFMIMNGARVPLGYHECTADRSCLISH